MPVPDIILLGIPVSNLLEWGWPMDEVKDLIAEELSLTEEDLRKAEREWSITSHTALGRLRREINGCGNG